MLSAVVGLAPDRPAMSRASRSPARSRRRRRRADDELEHRVAEPRTCPRPPRRARRGRRRARSPSLIIASPSTSSRTRAGAPMRENVAVAETGSVGPTIAPSTNAASQLMPGHDRVRDHRDGGHRGEHEPDRQQRERAHLGRAARAATSTSRPSTAAAAGRRGRRRPGRAPGPAARARARSRGRRATSTIGNGTRDRARPAGRSTAAAASSRIRNSMSPTAAGTLGSAAPCPTASIPRSAPATTSTGPPDAPLELVMYGDFQCPFCTAAQPILRARARPARRAAALRLPPLPAARASIPTRERAAEASEAAAAQGAFWPMHDALYGAARPARARGRRRRGARPRARRRAGAGRAGATARTPRASQRDVESGARRAASAGTPTFFVNGARHEGAFDAQSLIAALEGARLAAQLGRASSVAELAAVDRDRPAGEVDLQRLVDVDLELAAVERDGDRRRRRRAARTRPPRRTRRCPTTASPPRRARRSGRGSRPAPVGHQNETFVRLGNCGSCSIAGPIAGRSSASSSAAPATRIAHCGLPIGTCWKRRPATSPVPSGAAGREVLGAQPRAPHVDAARRRAEDRRADLAGRGLDRELVLVGPAAAAQVEDRLARAVARQLGLRAVRVEDPQARDEAGRRRAATARARRRRPGRCGGRRAGARRRA